MSIITQFTKSYVNIVSKPPKKFDKGILFARFEVNNDSNEAKVILKQKTGHIVINDIVLPAANKITSPFH